MSMCERCWRDARERAFGTAKSQTEVYLNLVAERNRDSEELAKCEAYNNATDEETESENE